MYKYLYDTALEKKDEFYFFRCVKEKDQSHFHLS